MDRHNGILMALLLLVAEKKSNCLAFLGVNLCENNMDVLDEFDILLIELINIEKHGIYEVATTIFLF